MDVDGNETPKKIPEQNKTYNVYRAIKLGLGDFFVKNGFKTACLGLSGGIDSAVVLSMAAETLGPENIRVLLMPSQFSSDHSVEDARELAENLGVEYQIVPINETFAALTATLGPVFGELPFNVAEENMQARIRGMMMMAISNKFGNVLLATSNKSEIAVGYGTLYGDTVGALSIIGDLYKSEVYDLARYINRQREIIPLNTIMKAPSAELRLEQKAALRCARRHTVPNDRRGPEPGRNHQRGLRRGRSVQSIQSGRQKRVQTIPKLSHVTAVDPSDENGTHHATD